MRKVPLRNPNKQSPASGVQNGRKTAVSASSDPRRTARGEESAPKKKKKADPRTESRELRAEERRLDKRAREDSRNDDRRRRVEEKQAAEVRRSEERILRDEERTLDARRRVDEKRAAEARRAEEARRREWEAREEEKARRRTSKRNDRDARTEDKEHRLQTRAKKRKLREAKRREREERKKARLAARENNPGFYNPELKLHRILAVLLCLLAVYVAVSFILREQAGGFGLAIADALLGCFSYAAFLIPLFMLVHAVLWKKDVRERMLVPKALSFPPLLLTVAMLGAAFGPYSASASFDARNAYLAGQVYTGGGAVGEAIARVLKDSVGIIGILLISLVGLAPFFLLYFRAPIKALAVLLRTRITERKIARAHGQTEAKGQPMFAPVKEPERLTAPVSIIDGCGTEVPLTAAEEPEKKSETPASASVSDRRRTIVRDLEDDTLTVERQQMSTGGRGRRLFDFEADDGDDSMEDDDIFAPPTRREAEPAVRRSVSDLMGGDGDDDFESEDLAVTREELRPVSVSAAHIPPVASAPVATRRTVTETPHTAAPTAPAEEAKTPEVQSGMDYFRSIAVTADTRGSEQEEEHQVPTSTATPSYAPAYTPVAETATEPARPAVTFSPSVTYTAEEATDEEAETEEEEIAYTASDTFFDEADNSGETEEEEEEDAPFAPAPVAAVRAAAVQSEPKPRTDGAFRPLTAPDERPAAPARDERPSTPPPAPPKPKRPYQYPPVSLLALPEIPDESGIAAEVQRNAEILVQTLESFKVHTHVSGYSRGPRITRYEIVPETGVRVRNITNLIDDISMNLAASGIRIESPIPGKSAVGIEVPNETPTMVRLRHLLDTPKFREFPEKTVVCLGEDVAGAPVYCDLAKTPHMLVAGATGMGKSVCINSIVTSLLYKATPDDVRLIMIDPKKVEFSLYRGIPHLLVPIVTDPKQAAGALSWAVSEMERRFSLFERISVRDLKGYMRWLSEGGEGEPLPRIVIIIDELHDLMMSAKDTVETSIARITAKARAAGIHLLIGTQRPSVDVITGTIKNNIPTRIAFHVSSQVDSRTILDYVGAEKLLTHGDMLYAAAGSSKPLRVQGAFVDEKEIERIVEFIKANNDAVSDEEADRILADIEREAEKCSPKKGDDDDDIPAGGGTNIPTDDDDRHLQWAALEIGFEFSRLSTSLLQRKLKIGYGKAAKILDALCEEGLISESNGAKPREILITREEFREMRVRAVEEETGGNF